jgi:hypothetical protein
LVSDQVIPGGQSSVAGDLLPGGCGVVDLERLEVERDRLRAKSSSPAWTSARAGLLDKACRSTNHVLKMLYQPACIIEGGQMLRAKARASKR